jgi:hypothetical protein
MIVQIPFSGFYDSSHSNILEHELYNSMFTDYKSGCENNDNLSNAANDLIGWRGVYVDYAKEYVKNFNHEFDLNLTFESLQSPKEYNFSTDRIFCQIDRKDLTKIARTTKKDILDKTAKSMFTSRDGFISFYDANYKTWGKISSWDYNQLSCLLEAFFLQYSNNVEGGCDDFDLMDSSLSDGFLFEVIYKNAPGIERLIKIHDRLNRKAA